jgi:hypothetical protein
MKVNEVLLFVNSAVFMTGDLQYAMSWLSELDLLKFVCGK